jgi:outer membrane protein assembly factor BamB
VRRELSRRQAFRRPDLFRIPTGAYTGASPVVDGGKAYFGTFNYGVMAVDLRARKIVWEYSNPDRQFPFYSSAVLFEGRVIVGGRDKAVHAIDAATGKGVWQFETRARVDSSPVVSGGRVYVGSSDGKLYALDAATGQKRWEFDAGDAITASPAVAAGRLVIGAADGRIYCFG